MVPAFYVNACQVSTPEHPTLIGSTTSPSPNVRQDTFSFRRDHHRSMVLGEITQMVPIPNGTNPTPFSTFAWYWYYFCNLFGNRYYG
jgi:hypothetical protein